MKRSFSLLLAVILCCSLAFTGIPVFASSSDIIDDCSTTDKLVNHVNLFTDTTNGDYIGDGTRIRKDSADDASMTYAVNGQTHAEIIVYEADGMPTHDFLFHIKSGNAEFKAIDYYAKKLTVPQSGWNKTVYDVYFPAGTTQLKLTFTIPGADFWAQAVGNVVIDSKSKPSAAPVITDNCSSLANILESNVVFLDTSNPETVGDTDRIRRDSMTKDDNSFIAYKLVGQTHAKVTVYEDVNQKSSDIKFYVQGPNGDYTEVNYDSKDFVAGAMEPTKWHKSVYDVYFPNDVTRLKIKFNGFNNTDLFWAQQIGEVVIDNQTKAVDAAANSATTDEPSASEPAETIEVPKTSDHSNLMFFSASAILFAFIAVYSVHKKRIKYSKSNG